MRSRNLLMTALAMLATVSSPSAFPTARTNPLATNGTGRRKYSPHWPKDPEVFTDEDGYRLDAAENKRARRAAKRVADMERAEARKARQGGPVRHDENGAPVYHVGARLP